MPTIAAAWAEPASRSLGLAPRCGLQPVVCAPRRIAFVALLLEDGCVALLAPPARGSGEAPAVAGNLHFPEDAPAEAVACTPDGTMLVVASRTSLSFFVVSALTGDGGALGDHERGRPAGLQAQLRWRQVLHCRPAGVGAASLVTGGMAQATRAIVAVVGANGLTLHDSGEADVAPRSAPRRTLHLGVSLCACRFTDDHAKLALAALDGRLFVRGRAAAGWTGEPVLLWCAHAPCASQPMRVCCLDFSRCGRWLALRGWHADMAIYDCAHFSTESPEEVLAQEGASSGAADSGAKMEQPERRLEGSVAGEGGFSAQASSAKMEQLESRLQGGAAGEGGKAVVSAKAAGKGGGRAGRGGAKKEAPAAKAANAKGGGQQGQKGDGKGGQRGQKGDPAAKAAKEEDPAAKAAAAKEAAFAAFRAAATSVYQDWRLSRYWTAPGKPPHCPAPSLLAWCRAPHGQDVICRVEVGPPSAEELGPRGEPLSPVRMRSGPEARRGAAQEALSPRAALDGDGTDLSVAVAADADADADAGVHTPVRGSSGSARGREGAIGAPEEGMGLGDLATAAGIGDDLAAAAGIGEDLAAAAGLGSGGGNRGGGGGDRVGGSGGIRGGHGLPPIDPKAGLLGSAGLSGSSGLLLSARNGMERRARELTLVDGGHFDVSLLATVD